jgi:hypothetical protein
MDNKDKINKKIELHIAEYNALTARCTYYTNIQKIILTAGMTLVAGLIASWKVEPEYNYIFRWGILCVLQIFGIISIRLFSDEYNLIYYIESNLRPKIMELIGEEIASFWNYQAFNAKTRSKLYKRVERLAAGYLEVILALFFILFIAVAEQPLWGINDSIGLVISILICIFFARTTSDTVRIRIKVEEILNVKEKTSK